MVDNSNEKQYNTDIIICIFDKMDVNCYDYIFDNENNNYIRNDNGVLSKRINSYL
jgi:hypothetical protein